MLVHIKGDRLVCSVSIDHPKGLQTVITVSDEYGAHGRLSFVVTLLSSECDPDCLLVSVLLSHFPKQGPGHEILTGAPWFLTIAFHTIQDTVSDPILVLKTKNKLCGIVGWFAALDNINMRTPFPWSLPLRFLG